MLFATTSSPEAKTFSWDFGDKSVNTTTTGRTTHAYETSGSYDVRVTVSDSFGNKNSLKHTLHVTDADAPLSVMDIQSGSIFSQEDPR